MAEKPHARRDNTAPELSDSFTPATVDELLRAIGAHLTEAGLNSAVVTKVLTEQLAAAPSSHDLEGAGNLPRLNRNSIPTELKQDDADLLLSGLKALEGYADSSGLWTDLNPVSSPGEREVHGGGSTGMHARLVQRELGSSEVNLSRKWDPSTANVDPLAPDSHRRWRRCWPRSCSVPAAAWDTCRECRRHRERLKTRRQLEASLRSPAPSRYHR